MKFDEFDDHEVVLHETVTHTDSLERTHSLEHLVFKRPGTGFYYIEFIMHNNYLHVTGDVGEATYWWSDRHDLAWVASCDLGYFHSKCTASPNGRDFKQWTKALVKARAEEALEELEDEKHRKRFYKWKGHHYMDTEFEWLEWLRSTARGVDESTKGEHFFGEEYLRHMPGIGYDVDVRCQMHLAALKLAMKKVKDV